MLQRVDLLAHLHGAELGGVGAAGAARHHDGNDQHADLAQHQDADHVDDVDVGAEFAEMENALLRDDGADQERDQQDDRHRPPADIVELMYHRGEAKTARVRHDARKYDHQRAQHVDNGGERAAHSDNAHADRADRGGERMAAAVRLRVLRRHAVHLVDQSAEVFLEPGHRGITAAR